MISNLDNGSAKNTSIIGVPIVVNQKKNFKQFGESLHQNILYL